MANAKLTLPPLEAAGFLLHLERPAVSAPIEAAQHEANSLSPCYHITLHFPDCSDKLSRLCATVRIDRVTLFLWNQELS